MLKHDKDGNPIPGSGSDAEIGYNPDIVGGPDGKAPSDATLFHEMGHADHDVNGVDRVNEPLGGGWDNYEEWQTIDGGVNKPGGANDIPGSPESPTENDYYEQRGYPYRRTDHDGGWVPA